MPGNTDRTIRNVLHSCGGGVCGKKRFGKKRGHRRSTQAMFVHGCECIPLQLAKKGMLDGTDRLYVCTQGHDTVQEGHIVERSRHAKRQKSAVYKKRWRQPESTFGV